MLVAGPELVAAPTPEGATPTAVAAPNEPTPNAQDPASTPEDLATTETATPTDQPAATPTPLPPPTPSPSPTPTPEPPAAAAAEPCTAGLAGDPVGSTTARADVDGDGAADQVTVYGTGSESDPAPWRIRVDTAAGESVDSPLSVDPTTDARAIGGADLGSGGADEVITVVGSGASTSIVAFHALVGCDLVQITSGSAPIGFPIGGGVLNLGGLQCLDTDGDRATDRVVAWLAVADFDVADGTYAIEGVEYELRGTDLRPVTSRTLSANVSEADFVYGNLTCGSVVL